MRQLSRVIMMAVIVSLAHGAHAVTVDEVVARTIEARGGAAKLKAIQSLRLTGKYLSGSDASLEMAWAQLGKRPAKIRTEVTLQGLTAVDAFDGREGWRVQPFGGRRDP